MEQVTVGVFRNPVGVIIPTLGSNIAAKKEGTSLASVV